MNGKQHAWVVIGVIVLAALIAVGFLAYQRPALLMDFVNLRYCG